MHDFPISRIFGRLSVDPFCYFDAIEFEQVIVHIQDVLLPFYNSHYAGPLNKEAIYQELEARRQASLEGLHGTMPQSQQHNEPQPLKRWFFVFDEIDKIFAKEMAKGHVPKDLNTLNWPFDLMANLRYSTGFTSVISASANNEAAHRNNHDGFDCYHHKTNMSDEEFNVWTSAWNYPILIQQRDYLKLVTGYCPLQVMIYLQNPADFEKNTILESERNEMANDRTCI